MPTIDELLAQSIQEVQQERELTEYQEPLSKRFDTTASLNGFKQPNIQPTQPLTDNQRLLPTDVMEAQSMYKFPQDNTPPISQDEYNKPLAKQPLTDFGYGYVNKYANQMIEPSARVIEDASKFTENPVSSTIGMATNVAHQLFAPISTGFTMLTDALKQIPSVNITDDISIGGKEFADAIDLPFRLLAQAPSEGAKALDKTGIIPTDKEVADFLGTDEESVKNVASKMTDLNSLASTLLGLKIAHQGQAKITKSQMDLVDLDKAKALGEKAIRSIQGNDFKGKVGQKIVPPKLKADLEPTPKEKLGGGKELTKEGLEHFRMRLDDPALTPNEKQIVLDQLKMRGVDISELTEANETINRGKILPNAEEQTSDLPTIEESKTTLKDFESNIKPVEQKGEKFDIKDYGNLPTPEDLFEQGLGINEVIEKLNVKPNLQAGIVSRFNQWESKKPKSTEVSKVEPVKETETPPIEPNPETATEAEWQAYEKEYDAFYGKDKPFEPPKPKTIEQQRKERAIEREKEIDEAKKRLPIAIKRAIERELYKETTDNYIDGGYNNKQQETDDKQYILFKNKATKKQLRDVALYKRTLSKSISNQKVEVDNNASNKDVAPQTSKIEPKESKPTEQPKDSELDAPIPIVRNTIRGMYKEPGNWDNQETLTWREWIDSNIKNKDYRFFIKKKPIYKSKDSLTPSGTREDYYLDIDRKNKIKIPRSIYEYAVSKAEQPKDVSQQEITENPTESDYTYRGLDKLDKHATEVFNEYRGKIDRVFDLRSERKDRKGVAKADYTRTIKKLVKEIPTATYDEKGLYLGGKRVLGRLKPLPIEKEDLTTYEGFTSKHEPKRLKTAVGFITKPEYYPVGVGKVAIGKMITNYENGTATKQEKGILETVADKFLSELDKGKVVIKDKGGSWQISKDEFDEMVADKNKVETTAKKQGVSNEEWESFDSKTDQEIEKYASDIRSETKNLSRKTEAELDKNLDDLSNFFKSESGKPTTDELYNKNYSKETPKTEENKISEVNSLTKRRRHLQDVIKVAKGNELAKAKSELNQVNNKISKIDTSENLFDGGVDDLLFQQSKQPLSKLSEAELNKEIELIDKLLPKNVNTSLDNTIVDNEGKPVNALIDFKTNTIKVNPDKANITSVIHEIGHKALEIVLADNPTRGKALLKLNGWDGKGDPMGFSQNQSLVDAWENISIKLEDLRLNEKEFTAKEKHHAWYKRILTRMKELWESLSNWYKKNGFVSEAKFYDDLFRGKMKGENGLPKFAEMYQKTKDAFYSKVEQLINQKAPNKNITKEQLLPMLEKNGAKKAELDWLDIEGFLEENPKATKQELLDYVKENNVKIEVVEKGGITENDIDTLLEDEVGEGMTRDEAREYLSNDVLLENVSQQNADDFIDNAWSGTNTRNSEWNPIPGGENYREIVLTMPKQIEPYEITDRTHYGDVGGGTAIVWARVDDRIIDNKKTLLVQELQSKRHQDGRKKGYKGSNPKPIKDINGELLGDAENWEGKVPNAPFKKTWHELGLKHIIREATEKGYDQIAFTTGEQQAERYDLSKQLDEISSVKLNNGEYNILAYDKNGKDISLGEISENDLADNVGKDLATKIIKDSKTKNRNVYSGLDLKVGGEGMKGFYDQMLPKYLNKFGKKFGARVGEGDLDIGDSDTDFMGVGVTSYEDYRRQEGFLPDENPQWLIDSYKKKFPPVQVHTFPITEKMKASVMEGQPLFQKVLNPENEYGAEWNKVKSGEYTKEEKEVNLTNELERVSKKYNGKIKHPLAPNEKYLFVDADGIRITPKRPNPVYKDVNYELYYYELERIGESSIAEYPSLGGFAKSETDLDKEIKKLRTKIKKAKNLGEKGAIEFNRYRKTGSYYGEYKNDKIRLSDHGYKWTKTDYDSDYGFEVINGVGFYHTDGYRDIVFRDKYALRQFREIEDEIKALIDANDSILFQKDYEATDKRGIAKEEELTKKAEVEKAKKPQEKTVKYNATWLKDRAKDIKQGHRLGKFDERETKLELEKAVMNVIHSLPQASYSKGELEKIAVKIKNSTEKNLQENIDTIVEIADNSEQKYYRRKIYDLTRKITKNKKSPKVDADTGDIFKFASDVIRGKSPEPETAIEEFVLNGLSTNGESIKKVYEVLKSLGKEGAERIKELKAKEKAEREKLVNNILDDMRITNIPKTVESIKGIKKSDKADIFAHTATPGTILASITKGKKDLYDSRSRQHYDRISQKAIDDEWTFKEKYNKLTTSLKKDVFGSLKKYEDGLEAKDTGIKWTEPIETENGVVNIETTLKASKSELAKRTVEWERDYSKKILERQGYTQELIDEIKKYIGKDWVDYSTKIRDKIIPKLSDEIADSFRDKVGFSLPREDKYVSVRATDYHAETLEKKFGIKRMPGTWEATKGANRLALETVGEMMDRLVTENSREMAYHDMKQFYFALKNAKVKKAFEIKGYKKRYDKLIKMLENEISGRVPSESGEGAVKMVNRAMGNIMKSWLIMPKQIIKQMTSQLAWLKVMPHKDFAVETAKAYKNPKETYDFVMENMPSIRKRYKIGFSTESEQAFKDFATTSKLWDRGIRKTRDTMFDALPSKMQEYYLEHPEIKRVQMSATIIGDAVPVITGVKAAYEFKYKQLVKTMHKDKAKKEAILWAEGKAGDFQQSAETRNKPYLSQEGGTMGRLLGAFKQSQMAYNQSMWLLGDIMKNNPKEAGRILESYILLTLAFTASSTPALIYALMDGEEDATKNLLTETVGNAINLPGVGDAVSVAKGYSATPFYLSPSLEAYREYNRVYEKGTRKKLPESEKILNAFSALTEYGGLPINKMKQYAKIQTEDNSGILGALGYTERQRGSKEKTVLDTINDFNNKLSTMKKNRDRQGYKEVKESNRELYDWLYKPVHYQSKGRRIKTTNKGLVKKLNTYKDIPEVAEILDSLEATIKNNKRIRIPYETMKLIEKQEWETKKELKGYK